MPDSVAENIVLAADGRGHTGISLGPTRPQGINRSRYVAAGIEMAPIDICIRINEVRKTSFATGYEIRKQSSGKVAATGKVVVVLFDWNAQTKMAISDELRQKVRAFQQEA